MTSDQLTQLAEEHDFDYALEWDHGDILLLDVDPGYPARQEDPGEPASITRAAILYLSTNEVRPMYIDDLDGATETRWLNQCWGLFENPNSLITGRRTFDAKIHC